jgi:hypothetical protein
VDPVIDQVAAEEMILSFRSLFSADGSPINAASILPGLLQKFGDVPDVLAQVARRKILVAAGVGGGAAGIPGVTTVAGRFSAEPRVLIDWIGS